MRIGTLFSGIGAPEQAAHRVYGGKVEMVFACEMDKFARESFEANYNIYTNHYHKDINDMDGTQYRNMVDIVIGGSPCQSFSIAGIRKGLEDKRGQLIWQYYRVIKEIMPPIFIYENVRGMLSDNNGKTLKDFLEVFRDLGYSCHADVLNTKDYGVPQNRERIYIVGFLDHEQYYRFEYEPKRNLDKRLKDILEATVDEKYFLSDKTIEGFMKHRERHKDRGNGFKFDPTDGGEVARCLSTKAGNRHTDNFIIVRGMLNIKGADRIRKLTPRECLRLQDFSETFKIVVSGTQIYKQAGNSMSVNVLEMIFKQIEGSRGHTTTRNLFDFKEEG